MEAGKERNKQGRYKERSYSNEFIHRLLYFVSFTILFVILINEAYKCFKVYQEKPTYTETRIVQQHHAAFPALSICPMPNGYKEDIVKVKDLRKKY